MSKIILTTLIFLLASCLPEQSARRIAGQQDNLKKDEINQPDPAEDERVAPYWLDGGQNYSTLTINYDNKKNHYLFGSEINRYLSQADNFYAQYCLYVPFITGSRPSRPLIALATPALSIDYSSGKRSRYFRVNLASSAGNEICDTAGTDSLESPPTAFGPLASKPSEVCDTCLNIVASEKLALYRVMDNGPAQSDYLLKLGQSQKPYGELPLNGLSMRIDMNGNSSGNTPTCSDAGCAAEGFDCCVNGQCVNEGSVKFSAIQSDPQGFNLAELEKLSNPKWYLNYPQFYYICLEDPQNGGGPPPLDPADPISDAEARLAEMLADYACVEELKNNSLENPFHREPINEQLPESAYQQCEITNTASQMHYTKVMKRLYANCGCSETGDLEQMVYHCPAYTYKLEFQQDALGNPIGEPTGVSCVTPPGHNNDLPFQDLEVIVNSRSAPHRFFNVDGEELDPRSPASLPGKSSVQEGDPFHYLDNEGLLPLNGSFNMNSILGQMSVSLDKARPAKKIDVEFDRVYTIAALSGHYSACPSCGKDSWFTNFSPYPSSNGGLGVRATGYTTSRDSWGTNSSFANYEDAIFGRACWVPPTMLPFGHSANENAQDQRLGRLKTQATMYVNGYQRDWFGFNQGALIGSFDGVTWFAIGKGRKVRATSNQLYLAINAPFADLASPTDHIVSVQEHNYLTTAAEYDYHPNEPINSPFQNDGGLCQMYHECDTDAHCISKLGWEYSCVDVHNYRTQWPTFSSLGAQENPGSARVGGIVEFLQQGELPPSTSSKKCVYRGAGAPCRVDIENAPNEGSRKALACAPNFYCERVGSNNFNKEVARFAAPLESGIGNKNHLFGQDADVLGRPKDYAIIGTGAALPTSVRNTLRENIELIDPSATQVGLCRPAKSLPTYGAIGLETSNYDPLDQHLRKDPQNRTDFISQIAGCNATLYTSLRYSSCPMLDEEGNYVHLQDRYIDLEHGKGMSVTDTFGTWLFQSRADAVKYYSGQQNMCGMESLDNSVLDVYSLDEESLRAKSAFKNIEARDLASSDVQIEPTLVQNACFRRAGSVCHTNYDCSPNFKHFEALDFLRPDVFGNAAERKFWEEYLVCSQERTEPVLTSNPSPKELERFKEYNMHNNRCCREVGKDLTLYTEDSPGAVESRGLRTDIYGGYQPNNPKRYSRYAASLPVVDDMTLKGTQKAGHSYTSRVSAKRPTDPTYEAGDPSILTSNQWKNIHDTAARTCCGGSWVRKFADGTNDWSRNRLNMDVSNFRCLNYKTPLMLTENPEDYFIDPALSGELARDRINFCPDSELNSAGCAQYAFAGIDDWTTKIQPELNRTTQRMRIDSDPDAMSAQWAHNEWSFMQLLSYAANPEGNNNSSDFMGMPYMDWSVSYADANNGEASQAIFTRIPAFITFEKITDIRIDLENPAPTADGSFIHDSIVGSDRERSCKRICPNGEAADANGECPNTTPEDYKCPAGWRGLCEVTEVNWSNLPWSVIAPPEEQPLTPYDCFYMYDDDTRRLKVVYDQSVINNASHYESKRNSLIIEFTAPGTMEWEVERVAPGTPIDDPAAFPHRRSSKPGNALYYLEKLAKLEFIGIPQMTYEPIFCNDIYQKLVPGIFKDGIKSAGDFINHPDTFTDPTLPRYWNVNGVDTYNPEFGWTNEQMKQVADQSLLAHEPIFSDHEFKCCLPLGSEVDSPNSAGLCCSGTAKEKDDGSGDDAYMCALPTGTNLNVYFNKFVSGEGLNEEYLSTARPLTVEDFDPKTGSPKSSAAVINKLKALGQELCAEGAVAQGGAFGPFYPEPAANYQPAGSNVEPINSIVDSPFDIGNINAHRVGYDEFQKGYRWNHHVYCAEGGN